MTDAQVAALQRLARSVERGPLPIPTSLFAVIALALPTGAHAAGELKAGVARVEITPSTFMPMYGYANRKCGPANGR